MFSNFLQKTICINLCTGQYLSSIGNLNDKEGEEECGVDKVLSCAGVR